MVQAAQQILSFQIPEWKLLKISNVKVSPYNPKSRVTARRLHKLIISMRDIGLQYPILVDKQYTVIDGHRRLAAAGELDWETIMAIVSGMDPHKVYAGVNETSSKLTGNDSLRVWLMEPEAVSPALGKKFVVMTDILGRGMVKKMAEHGLSIGTFRTAVAMAHYTGDVDPGWIVSCSQWLMEAGSSSAVRYGMAYGVEAKKLEACVRKMKPLV